jgi:hypothetical protein
MQPKIVKHFLNTFLHKTRLLFVFLGEMYIIFVLFIAVIIAALITILSYLPLLIIGSTGKIGKRTLYNENLMVN